MFNRGKEGKRMRHALLGGLAATLIAGGALASGLDDIAAGDAALDRDDADAAVVHYTRALGAGDLKPKDRAVAHGARCQALELAGDHARALDDCDAALGLARPEAWILLNRGDVHRSLGEYAKAFSDYDAAVQMKPSADSYIGRGLGHAALGRFSLAAGDYERALAMDPKSYYALLNLGVAYGEMGRIDEAIAAADRAIAINPGEAPAYNNRGLEYSGRRRFAEALADHDKAIRLAPRDPAGHQNRAVALIGGGDLEAGLKEIEAALALAPKDPNILYARGVTRFHLGRWQPAVTDLAAAVNADPSKPYPAMWLHIARLRSGEAAQSPLAAVAARSDGGAWPAPVVHLWLGKASLAAVDAAAQQGDAAQRPVRECEAAFYGGAYLLATGATDAARPRLERAVAICPGNLVEYSAARAELARSGFAN